MNAATLVEQNDLRLGKGRHNKNTSNKLVILYWQGVMSRVGKGRQQPMSPLHNAGAAYPDFLISSPPLN